MRKQRICTFCKIPTMFVKVQKHMPLGQKLQIFYPPAQVRLDWWEPLHFGAAILVKIDPKPVVFCGDHCKEEYEELYGNHI